MFKISLIRSIVTKSKGFVPLTGMILENPSLSSPIDSNQIFIKGWILSVEVRNDIKVIVSTDVRRYEIFLDQDRPDVINAQGAVQDKLKCGFQVSLPLLTSIKETFTFDVKFTIGEMEYSWYQITIKIEEQYHQLLKIWNALATNETETLLNNDLLISYTNKQVEVFQNALKQQHIAIQKLEDISSQATLSSNVMNLLQVITTQFSQPTIFKSMIENAMENEQLTIFLFPNESPFVCDSSIAMNDYNILRYTRGHEVFYILQYGYSAIAVYYPAANCSVSFSYWDVFVPHIVNNTNGYLLANFKVLFPYFDKKTKRIFSGFVLGNSRPYHFYYDQYAVLHAFLSELPTNKLLPIISIENNLFMPISMALGDHIEEHFFSHTEQLNVYNYKNNSFSVLVGASNNKVAGKEKTLDFFSNIVREVKTKAYDDVFLLEKIIKLRKCFPIVWIGVTGQKRLWVEQEQGLIKIINKLALSFPGMAVIFDGWTSPLNPTHIDNVEIENDKKVANIIFSALPESVTTVSVIGKSSFEKIALGNEVDFYITNWLQGSLHVDNICKKKGVGHNNKSSEYLNYFYRNHCLRIPDCYIDHIGEEDVKENNTSDFISYSIAWQRVYEVALDLFQKLPLRNLIENK